MEQSFFPVHIAGQIVLLNILTALAFLVTLAGGIGRSRARTFSQGPWLRLGLILAGWYALVYALASSGWISIELRLFGVLPTLVPAIFLPSVAGTLLLVSSRFRENIDRVSLGWLAAFHVLRIPFGFVFLALYELGEIPAIFAFRGGYGDITAGLLGLLVTGLWFGGRKSLAKVVAVIWIVQGLGDFALILYTGLTAIPADAPFRDFYPFILIPAYVVPMFILTHIYAIRSLIVNRG